MMLMQLEKTGITGEKVKQFFLTALGSIFVQVFCWAVYSYLSLSTWMCILSVTVTALLYHFVQKEEETGLPRTAVFFAAILLPFALSAVITVVQLLRYPQLNLLGAQLDGVSPLTETVSLYAARLTINGGILCIFAAIDRAFRKRKGEMDHDSGKDT